MRIIPRSEWGAAPAKNRTMVDPSRRTAFGVHYDGDAFIRYAPGPCRDICYPKIRATQRFHQVTRGWADIGYNFWICNAHGTVFEGRGWDVLGAHAGAAGNVPAIGVQIHIGGNQQPSDLALNSCRELYDEGCRRFGRALAKRGHRDYMSTSCPGEALYKWVRAGMPATATPINQAQTQTNPAQEVDVITNEDRQLIAAEVVKQAIGNGGLSKQFVEALLEEMGKVRGHTLFAQAAAKGVAMTGVPQVVAGIAQKQGVPVEELAAGIAASLTPTIREAVKAAAGQGGDPDTIADAVVARLGEALTT